MPEQRTSLYKIGVDYDELAKRINMARHTRYTPRYIYLVYNGYNYSRKLQTLLLNMVAREPLPKQVEIPPCAQ